MRTLNPIFILISASALSCILLSSCGMNPVETDPSVKNEMNVTENESALSASSTSVRTLSSAVVVTPSQDGRAFSIYPDHAADYATYFASQAWTWSGKSGKVRSHMQFDLSEIPSGAIISSAVLKLYHHPDVAHSSLSKSNASYIERITSSWTADQLTWNYQPPVTTSNRVYLSQSVSPTQDYTLDVTNMVRDMVMYGNYGMRIKLATESYYAQMYFASSNYSNPAYHPRLEVVFTY